MNTQRKITIGLLAVAMLALVADRIFLDGGTGPQSASAESADDSTSVERYNLSVAPSAAESDQIFLANRLQSVQAMENFDLDAVPNAFKPSSSWIQPKAEIVQHATKPKQVPVIDTVAQFIKEKHLNAVVGTGDGAGVIVNGKRWTVGRTVDGWTLKGVTTRTALFERNGKLAELSIAGPNVPKE